MGKTGLILTGIIVVITAIAIMPDEALDIAEALYSIPPTPAWSNIVVSSDANFTDSGQNFTNATSYTDRLYIISDGSINITIGQITLP